jgi:hypothetical protein
MKGCLLLFLCGFGKVDFPVCDRTKGGFDKESHRDHPERDPKLVG